MATKLGHYLYNRIKLKVSQFHVIRVKGSGVMKKVQPIPNLDYDVGCLLPSFNVELQQVVGKHEYACDVTMTSSVPNLSF